MPLECGCIAGAGAGRGEIRASKTAEHLVQQQGCKRVLALVLKGEGRMSA